MKFIRKFLLRIYALLLMIRERKDSAQSHLSERFYSDLSKMLKQLL